MGTSDGAASRTYVQACVRRIGYTVVCLCLPYVAHEQERQERGGRDRSATRARVTSVECNSLLCCGPREVMRVILVRR